MIGAGGMSVQNEAAEVLADWKATYGEIFPHRNPEAMRVDDADLALAVLLRREMRMASRAALSPREMDRLAKHNPKDQE